MKTIKLIYPTFLLILLIPLFLSAQHLKPGFDKEEYKELMLISARSTSDSAYYNTFPEPQHFKMVYHSPEMGLANMWDLWKGDNSVAAISIRGTTSKQESWLANFYAAMVPARGKLQLSANDVFEYELASNPKAAVHIGWLLSTAYLSRDMLPKIDLCYKKGTREFLIMGHSQGGGIAYLLTAFLLNLQDQKLIPADIRFKTYGSASPKPGNLFFAYDYEALTQGGWAFNVVNSADWVPETPVSVQTLNDFNTTNPFVNVESVFKKQKFPKNMLMKHVFKKMENTARKAQRNYEKYLGEMTSKLIKSYLPDFIPPQYYPSSHYVRTGTTIVLNADDAYYKLFPDDKKNVFTHHAHTQYLYLLEQLND
ncbi:MAG: lipase family protein [Bacteroidales bacterium]|nr:lipase family protein [Bacteroidales bacterium]